jgi:hypothetical protein
VAPVVALFPRPSCSRQPVQAKFGVDYTGYTPFDSGSTFNALFTGDSSFATAFAVTTGSGYGAPVGQLAFQGFSAGFANAYDEVVFKIKGVDSNLIRVKFQDPQSNPYVDVTLTSSTADYTSTDIGDGWYQVVIPLDDSFGDVSTSSILIFENNTAASNYTFYLTDIGFNNAPGGGGGELLTNGTFETGDISGWELVTNDGTFNATMDQAASGAWSGNLVASVPASGGPASFPVATQRGLAQGVVTPGQNINVSFDLCGVVEGIGGVFQSAILSEISGGGASDTNPLFGNIPLSETWTNYQMSLAAGSDVSGGITLQLKADCGGNPGCTVNAYVDNVSVTLDGDTGNPSNAGGACPIGGGNEPVEAAPEPTRAGGSVISIFSDPPYTDVAGTNFDPDWGQATDATIVSIAGNDTLKYAGLNYQGTSFGSGQNLTAAGMTHLHLDFWTADATALQVYLISPGPVETPHVLTVTQNTWVSVDIPLTNFSPVDLANAIEFKFVGDGTVYLDNLYFYDETPATAPVVAAPTPTEDALGVISIFSDPPYTDVAGTNFDPDWGQATDATIVSIAGNDTLKYAGLNYQGTSFGSSQNLTAAGMKTLHLDFWTADATALQVYLISPGPVETPYDLPIVPANLGTWVSVEIPLTNFAPVDLANAIEFKFVGNGTVYLDNLYFSTTDGGGGGGAELVNGDFETGDFTGWTQTPDAGTNVTPGTITLVTSAPGSRAGAVARLEAAGDAIAGSQDVLLTQVLAAGTLNVGDTIDVSFDLYGSLAGAGGVVFVELIYLNGAGDDTGTRSFVDGGAPKVPTTTWSTYSDSIVVPSIPDVSGGVVLQLKSSCGPVDGCGVDAYFDNVSATITP